MKKIYKTVRNSNPFFVLPSCLALLFLTALVLQCDMDMVNPAARAPSPELLEPGISTGEKETLEREGHFLKIINMPYNTLARHASLCEIFNSAAKVAGLDKSAGVLVYRHGTTKADVYINLAYNNGDGGLKSEFIENGDFYVALNVFIDALSWLAIPRSAAVIVQFSEGRGTLDPLSLIGATDPDGNPIVPDTFPDPGLDPDEAADIELNGHFLKLINMPLATQGRHVTDAKIYNSSQSIAGIDKSLGILTRRLSDRSTVYINLSYTGQGGHFLGDGPHYVSLSVFIDALTWINLPRSACFIVNFESGRGTLDALSLIPLTDPDGNPVTPDTFPTPEGGGGSGGGNPPTDQQIRDLIENGHYLKLYHTPHSASREHFSNISVSTGSQSIARADPQNPILIEPDASFTNAYIPLVDAAQGAQFTRTGSFIVSFNITIDAFTKIIVPISAGVSAQFLEGRATVDIENLLRSNPDVVVSTPDPEQEHEENIIDQITSQTGYIHLYNVPRDVSKSKILSVRVSTAARSVAACYDYNLVGIRKNTLDAEVFIPLVSTLFSAPFTDSGSYYVSFSIFIDALLSLEIKPDYKISYYFTDGVTDINALDLPRPPTPPPSAPHALTIFNLPDTASPAAFHDVFILNSAGNTAKCQDYSAITATTYNGRRAVTIPLVYENSGAFNGTPFAEAGTFKITFNFYPDALTSFSVSTLNNCLADFENGSAVLNYDHIPTVPHNYLSITNLPANTQLLNASQVFVYNQQGKLAKCEDYNLIIVEHINNSTTIHIPLYYDSYPDIFSETGHYKVAFDLNIDTLTRILINQSHNITAYFLDGGATLDASTLPTALPTPYLTILGLPLNVAKSNFQDVFVWNTAGQAAKLQNNQDIIIEYGDPDNGGTASAMLPLVYFNSPTDFFRDSGDFAVSFKIVIDASIQITKTRADSLACNFTLGSGVINLADSFGYFSGGIQNPNDTSPPIIKQGTVFEMNNGYFTVTANTPVPAITLQKSTLLYIYASAFLGNLTFEYSTQQPYYDEVKKAYYDDTGNKRALFTVAYIHDSPPLYVNKLPMGQDIPAVKYYTLNNFNQASQSLSAFYSRASSSSATTVSLPAGGYIIVLKGSGGGGGAGINGEGPLDRKGGSGGNGGSIGEFLLVPSATSISAFSGYGGSGAAAIYDVANQYVRFQSMGGGGGGSASLIYAPSIQYFLTAGGGGGGGGADADGAASGGGGSGGAISGGAAGGHGAWYHWTAQAPLPKPDPFLNFYPSIIPASFNLIPQPSGLKSAHSPDAVLITQYNSALNNALKRSRSLDNTPRQDYFFFFAGGGGSSTRNYYAPPGKGGNGGGYGAGTIAPSPLTYDHSAYSPNFPPPSNSPTEMDGRPPTYTVAPQTAMTDDSGFVYYTGWVPGRGAGVPIVEHSSPADSWRNTNGAQGQGGASTYQGFSWRNQDSKLHDYELTGATGEDGGNNRTPHRGGGAQGGSGGQAVKSSAAAGSVGSTGSVYIYKVF